MDEFYNQQIDLVGIAWIVAIMLSYVIAIRSCLLSKNQ